MSLAKHSAPGRLCPETDQTIYAQAEVRILPHAPLE